MTNPDPTPEIPSLAATVTHSLAQKAGAMAAAALLAAGLIPNTEFDQDTSLLAGVAALALSVAWTFVRDWLAHRRTTALAGK